MKKTALALMMICLAALAAIAQPRNGRNNVPPPTRHTVSFESRHGEAFSVYIDGDLMNRMPQTRVMVNDLSDMEHEVIVVLKRPAEKAALLYLDPREANIQVSVNYDGKQERLFLYTPEANRGGQRPPERRQTGTPRTAADAQQHAQPTPPPPAPEQAHATSNEEVVVMVQRMKAQSFDSDRLALGKALVAANPMTASQIARLAATIDFSSSQVDFLKYAYPYCTDKKNYNVVIDVLTYSSDRQTVLNYIATQQ